MEATNRRRGRAAREFQPNAFLALQVKSPDIHKNLVEVAGKILDYDERLAEAVESVAKAHITLLVAQIEDEEVERVTSLVELYVQQNLRQNGLPLDIDFQGLGSFGERVVFAKPTSSLELIATIANDLSSALATAGIRVKLENAYKPHLTIMKMGWGGPGSRKRRIPKEAFSSHQEVWFGRESITAIQLLSMSKPKAANGYYHSLGEISFVISDQVEAVDGADIWADAHRNCCANQAWKDRLSEAKERFAPAAELTHTSILSEVVSVVGENADTVTVSSSFYAETTTTVTCAVAVTDDDTTFRDEERREDRQRALAAEKEAARARARECVAAFCRDGGTGQEGQIKKKD